MAELLVRVVDKVNPNDPYLDAKCTKRGDVICVQPDGWVWGREEQTNPEWRIVRVPGLSVTQCLGFLAPEIDIDPQHPSKVLQRRAFKLDVDHPDFTALAEGRKGKPAHRFNLDLAGLLARKKAKPPLDDPNVLK